MGRLTRKSLKVGVPLIWREQKNHDNCYFCMDECMASTKIVSQRLMILNTMGKHEILKHIHSELNNFIRDLDYYTIIHFLWYSKRLKYYTCIG